jgi:hypothetical protein
MTGTAASLPATTGTANWTDITNNWTAADAEWLQARSIIRVTNDSISVSAAGGSGVGSLAAVAAGQTFYGTTAQTLFFRDASSYRYTLASRGGVSVDLTADTTTASIIKGTGASPAKIVFTNNSPFVGLNGITGESTSLPVKIGFGATPGSTTTSVGIRVNSRIAWAVGNDSITEATGVFVPFVSWNMAQPSSAPVGTIWQRTA